MSVKIDDINYLVIRSTMYTHTLPAESSFKLVDEQVVWAPMCVCTSVCKKGRYLVILNTMYIHELPAKSSFKVVNEQDVWTPLCVYIGLQKLTISYRSTMDIHNLSAETYSFKLVDGLRPLTSLNSFILTNYTIVYTTIGQNRHIDYHSACIHTSH
jgi:hypothetical protein